MNRKKIFAGFAFLVLLSAIYVVADFTLKTQSGDLVLDPASNKVGIGTSSPLTNLHIVDTTSEKIRIGYDGSRYMSLITGTTGATINSVGVSDGLWFNYQTGKNVRIYGSSSSVWNQDYIGLQHDGTDGKVTIGDGDLIIDPNGNDVYIGSDKTVGNAKNLYADSVFTNNGTCGSWDTEEKYYDLDLLDTIISSQLDDGRSVWDLSGLVKKNEKGEVIQSVLHTEVVPETELHTVVTDLGEIEERVPTGRMVNSTWINIGELNGYLLGVNKALYEKIKELEGDTNLLKQELCKKDKSYSFCK